MDEPIREKVFLVMQQVPLLFGESEFFADEEQAEASVTRLLGAGFRVPIVKAVSHTTGRIEERLNG